MKPMMHGAITFPNHIYYNCNANWKLHVFNLVKRKVAPDTIPKNVLNTSIFM